VTGQAPTTQADELEAAFEARVAEKMLELVADPSRAYAAFLGNLPLTMFLLLPFFALLLKMFYPRRFYAEHFVFALHLHAFFYLVFTALIFIPESQAVMLTEGVRALDSAGGALGSAGGALGSAGGALGSAEGALEIAESGLDSHITSTEVNAAHPFWGFLADLLAFACMAYAFLALKSTYQQSVGRTLVKGFFLTITYATLLGIALVISLVATFLLY
jgi:hypothetical protein